MIGRGALALPHLLAEDAVAAPDRLFLQEVGGVAQTCAEFHESSLRWASALADLGVVAGDTVATMLPASAAAYHCWIGIGSLRAVEVPVNHEYSGRMLLHVLDDSQATVALVSSRFLAAVVGVADKLQHVRTLVVPDADRIPLIAGLNVVPASEFFAHTVGSSDLEPVELWDTASIIYTSGTTGLSKGVVCSWAHLAEGPGAAFPYGEPVRHGGYYSPWQPFHLTGRVALEIAVRHGLRLVIRDRFSVGSLWDDVRAYDCTHFFCAFIGAWLWRQPRRSDDADNPLERVLMAPLIPEYREFEQRFGVKLATGYASVEAGFPVEAAYDPPDYRTCGRARDGYELRIVDEHDMEVPVGEVGELIVRAEPWRSFGGYFNDPDATAAVLRNGWFHTGDAFRADEDGNLYLVDRIRDYLKVRGKTIAAAEVEVSVLECPLVAECACVGVPSDLSSDGVVGGDDIRIFVVPQGDGITAERVAEAIASLLPRSMLPQYVDIVDELPKNHVNKVKKDELRALPITGVTWRRAAPPSRQ